MSLSVVDSRANRVHQPTPLISPIATVGARQSLVSTVYTARSEPLQNPNPLVLILKNGVNALFLADDQEFFSNREKTAFALFRLYNRVKRLINNSPHLTARQIDWFLEGSVTDKIYLLAHRLKQVAIQSEDVAFLKARTIRLLVFSAEIFTIWIRAKDNIAKGRSIHGDIGDALLAGVQHYMSLRNYSFTYILGIYVLRSIYSYYFLPQSCYFNPKWAPLEMSKDYFDAARNHPISRAMIVALSRCMRSYEVINTRHIDHEFLLDPFLNDPNNRCSITGRPIRYPVGILVEGSKDTRYCERRTLVQYTGTLNPTNDRNTVIPGLGCQARRVRVLDPINIPRLLVINARLLLIAKDLAEYEEANPLRWYQRITQQPHRIDQSVAEFLQNRSEECARRDRQIFTDYEILHDSNAEFWDRLRAGIKWLTRSTLNDSCLTMNHAIVWLCRPHADHLRMNFPDQYCDSRKYRALVGNATTVAVAYLAFMGIQQIKKILKIL